MHIFQCGNRLILNDAIVAMLLDQTDPREINAIFILSFHGINMAAGHVTDTHLYF